VWKPFSRSNSPEAKPALSVRVFNIYFLLLDFTEFIEYNENKGE
jgi:hypothetical protein